MQGPSKKNTPGFFALVHPVLSGMHGLGAMAQSSLERREATPSAFHERTTLKAERRLPCGEQSLMRSRLDDWGVALTVYHLLAIQLAYTPSG